MIDLLGIGKKSRTGFLDGQFLIAMPSLHDGNFARAVVYICVHSDDGAMGFVINRARDISFSDILVHLNITSKNEAFSLPPSIAKFPVLAGGPVDHGRGFVLHSEDYHCPSSIPLTEEICLSTTQDVVRAIAAGKGPKQAALMLGYAGWRAGQLENEIAKNAWLTCSASEALIFDTDLETKYDRAMALLGVSTAWLSNETGHA